MKIAANSPLFTQNVPFYFSSTVSDRCTIDRRTDLSFARRAEETGREPTKATEFTQESKRKKAPVVYGVLLCIFDDELDRSVQIKKILTS